MKKILLISFIVWCVFTSHAQKNQFEIPAPAPFSKDGYSFAHFNNSSGYFHLNLQSNSNIFRLQYDSLFRAINGYEILADKISLNPTISKKLHVAEVIESSIGLLEVYTDLKKILILKPDFHNKKDSVVLERSLQSNAADERLITLIPQNDGLKILSKSPALNTLFLCEWKLGDTDYSDKKLYKLPATNLENADIKKFPKPVRVLFSRDLVHSQARRVDQSSFFGLPSSGSKFFNREKIFLCMDMYYDLGICVLELDMNRPEYKITNYLVNDLKYNSSDTHPLNKRSVSYLVYDSVLLIRNISALVFEYHFYNMNTGQKIKEYKMNQDRSMDFLLHSDYKQIGTWGSKNEEKNIDKNKAFQRKLKNGGIFLSSMDKMNDSITITHIAYNYTSGIEGTMLSLASYQIGSLLNIHYGPMQIIPYLYSYRYKLAYAHSRFSVHNMELSKSNTVRTLFDRILKDIERKDLSQTSSFFVKDKKSLLLGIYNTQTRQFQITEYNAE